VQRCLSPGWVCYNAFERKRTFLSTCFGSLSFIHHKEEKFTMKLKKIASLMLAGVMAVSMLAGCSTADVAPTPDPDPEEPSATSYSAVMQNAFESKDIMKIHFTDDSNLDKALETAV